MSEHGLIGAIEAGGTKFVLALATHNGEILARTRLPTRTPKETFAAIGAFFEEAASSHGAVSAFGVASFGPVDVDPASPAYGTITTTPKPGWSGARYQDALARFGVPLVIDSDVNGAGLGEWRAGAGQGCRTIAYTTIGTGIGTGVIQDGHALIGFSHAEGGHIIPPHDRSIDRFAGICPYHGGCLEGLASGPAIERRWGRSLDAMADDPSAVALIARYIAHLASTLILLHMPDRLIFGGGVMKTPGLIEQVRSATEAALNGYVSNPRLDEGLVRYIVTPSLGDDAGIVGAAELGRRALSAG